MVNWEEIKRAYLTENVSYRQLSERYHVGQRTIERRGAEEKWSAQREEKRREMQQQSWREETTLRRAQRIQNVADQMLDKVAQALNETLSGTELRSLAGTLKSIKEIQMIQSPLDEKEQRIKIAALEKQAEKEEGGGITVVLEGELREYAG